MKQGKRYRVLLKTRVTRWVEVDVPVSEQVAGQLSRNGAEWAADDAVNLEGPKLRNELLILGYEAGPVELAYEELDESVEEMPS
jgi:hypothetical protein